MSINTRQGLAVLMIKVNYLSTYAICAIDWLIDCLTARQHRKDNLCQLRGGKLAQAAKDCQRDTMHNTLRYTITM